MLWLFAPLQKSDWLGCAGHPKTRCTCACLYIALKVLYIYAEISLGLAATVLLYSYTIQLFADNTRDTIQLFAVIYNASFDIKYVSMKCRVVRFKFHRGALIV